MTEDKIIAKEWHELEDDAVTEGEAAIRIVASAAEALREKSFADLTEDERRRVSLLIRRLAATSRCGTRGGTARRRAARAST